MEYITDTHPLVWWLFAQNRLSARVSDIFHYRARSQAMDRFPMLQSY